METKETTSEPVSRREVEEIEEMVVKNRELLEENNRLLKKIHRGTVWAFWIRLLWIAIILGVPFLLYYYLLEPYFELFGLQLPEFYF